MTRREPYEYAIIRVVPDVARGECMNAGVLLYCKNRGFLAAAVDLDCDRLLALAPGIDTVAVARSLEAAADCEPRDGENIGQRFRWLTAPRSTVISPGPVHTGLTADPAAELARLLTALVKPSV